MPGVFLGAFILNALLGLPPAGGLTQWQALAMAGCIAMGATLQAWVGYALVTRWFGRPARLNGFQDVLRLLAVAGPLSCLVSPTIGIAALYLFGDQQAAALLPNWLTWWAGDVFGVLVFMPLVLVMPLGEAAFTWRDREVRGLHAIGLTLLVLPLVITFLAWRFLAGTAHQQSRQHFETLARESEQALNTRLAAYAGATRSGAAVFQSSVQVSRDEWRTFTESLRVRDDYPGMLGLGWIERFAWTGKSEYLERVRKDGAPNFRIHPDERGAMFDVITYIEPELNNSAALGRNIALEPHLRDAAEAAVTTGLPTLTRPIRGVQEDAAWKFLLLQPVFHTGAPLDNPEQRRRALRGFVYAPFLAQGLLADQTPSQGRSLDISLFDGADTQAEPVLDTRLARADPWFSVRREIHVFGQTWIVNWQSTPEFEKAEQSHGAFFVLFGGLLFTGLFAVLLVVFGSRRAGLSRRADRSEQPWFLPLATFVLVAGGSVAAYAMLSQRRRRARQLDRWKARRGASKRASTGPVRKRLQVGASHGASLGGRRRHLLRGVAQRRARPGAPGGWPGRTAVDRV